MAKPRKAENPKGLGARVAPLPCEAAATPVFLLSLRPQSNVNWFHVYGLTCKMLGDTSRFVRLSSFRLWAFLTTESKSESTNEHMHSGGIHCWKSFANLNSSKSSSVQKLNDFGKSTITEIKIGSSHNMIPAAQSSPLFFKRRR